MPRSQRRNPRAKGNRTAAPRGRSGQLRIIGGRWRGRRLPIATVEGLRPTTDRNRETLFNWLAPELEGRHVLDLFAGTGALGLEALSRGAASCSFVEYNTQAAANIRNILTTLDATEQGTVYEGDGLAFSGSPQATAAAQGTSTTNQHQDLPCWDLVFLDPPFHSNLLPKALAQLEQLGIATDALLYMEYGKGDAAPEHPGWTEIRQKRAGDVYYGLYRRSL